jgi:cell shape-determining protein MreC
MSKNRFKVVSALVVISSLAIPTFAMADQKVPSPTTSTPVDANNAFKAAMEKFRLDQKNFLDALKNYDAARRTINKAFKESVDKALSEAKSLAAPGQTQLQKRMSAAAKQSAVIAATAIRDAAIEALGPAPIPPTPPAKEPRKEKSKRPQPSAAPNQSGN